MVTISKSHIGINFMFVYGTMGGFFALEFKI